MVLTILKLLINLRAKVSQREGRRRTVAEIGNHPRGDNFNLLPLFLAHDVHLTMNGDLAILERTELDGRVLFLVCLPTF